MRLPWWVVLLLSMSIGAFISVMYGKELNWDVAHYHYYGPYSLLYHRDTIDYFPSSYIHQYINPTIDFITYFFITYLSPRYAEAFLGAIHGINIALLFGIALLFVQGRYRYLFAILLTFIGIYGPTVWSGMGSFQNDNLVAVFMLFSLFWMLRYQGTRIAGFAMGLGVGLKLTASVYLIGMMATLLLQPLPFKKRLQQATYFASFAMIGIVITSGYWMFHQWQLHGNPLFPFFNNIFHSPDFSDEHWRDLRYLPKDIVTAIFFPFYFWNGSNDDAPSTDIRFAVLYLLAFVLLITGLLNKRKPFPPNARFIALFFLVAYLAWECYFSIARYLATLEMLTPILIYILAQHLPLSSQNKNILIVILLYTIAFVMTPRTTIRNWNYETDYFNVKLPPIVKKTPDAIVLISYTAYVSDRDPRPQTYLIPFFPKTWAFIGVPFWHQTYLRNPNALTTTLNRLAEDKPIFILSPDITLPAFMQAASVMHLTLAGPCEPITSDRIAITHQPVFLCPMKKDSHFPQRAVN